jgi:hypothetical protein
MQLMVNSERVYIVIKSAFAGSLYLVLAFLVAADLQFVRFHALLLQDFRVAASPSRYSEMAFFSSTKFQKKKTINWGAGRAVFARSKTRCVARLRRRLAHPIPTNCDD